MKFKKLFSALVVVMLISTIAATTVSAADLPIAIGTPENVTVTKDGNSLSVTYALGSSDRSMLQLAANPSLLAMFGVESLDVGAQVDYKVVGLTDWLAEDKLISGPCNLTDTLSVTVSNPALALVNWDNTTLMVRVRWAGSVKMKGEDATFMNGDWSDVAYFGKIPVIVPDPTSTEAEPTMTEAEPTVTEAEPTVTEAAPTATGMNDGILGDANDDGLMNMKDVLVIRKHIAGMSVEINLQNSDVNRDDAVNLKDVLLIRKCIAGISSL